MPFLHFSKGKGIFRCHLLAKRCYLVSVTTEVARLRTWLIITFFVVIKNMMLLTFIETCQLLKSFAWNFWIFLFHLGHDPHWGKGWASITPEERCHKLYVTLLKVSWLPSVEKNQCFRLEENENCIFFNDASQTKWSNTVS